VGSLYREGDGVGKVSICVETAERGGVVELKRSGTLLDRLFRKRQARLAMPYGDHRTLYLHLR